jgi:hypothetical protein
MMPDWAEHLAGLGEEARTEVWRMLSALSSFYSDRHPVVKRELSFGLRQGAQGKLTVRERGLLDAYFSTVQAPLLTLVTLVEPE